MHGDVFSWNNVLELLISKRLFFASSFTAFTTSWFNYEKHLLVIV